MNRRSSNAKNIRHVLALMMCAALFCLIVLSVCAAEPPRELRPARLRLLYSDSLFLNSNSEAPKVSSVILPVFFGKTDAAVVKRYGWETMKEVNPQLAAQLQILTNSSRLTDAVICLTRDTRENPFRDDLIRGTAELHADPQGQQILLLFKTDKMAPFETQHLDGVRDIIAKSGGPAPSPERKAAVTASGGKPKS